MAVQVLQDIKIWVGEHDFSGYLTSTALNYSAEMLDNTVFGDSTRSRLGGIKGVTIQHEGYWQSTPDESMFNKMGLNNVPITMSPTDGADGSLAYLFQSALGQYSPGGSVGELMAFSVSGEANGNMARGLILHTGQETSTGTGTGRQLGAVASGESMYAALHVLSASASDTLDVTVYSDDNASFTSATLRGTFTQATDETSEFIEIAGPVTDDYWRIEFTIAGTDPDFTFVAALGIA